MSGDVESYIRQKCPWVKLPASVKQILGDNHKKYEKLVIEFSVKNQLRFRGNLVRTLKKDERSYYEELLRYSREHLMLYPYHLSNYIVTYMRVTPFQYYISIMQDLMEQEKSYDSLPNFTAFDCLRLLGIGRNQYIDLMNQCRSQKKFFAVHRSPIRDSLPSQPVSTLVIEPWWTVYIGYVTEEDMRNIQETEKVIIDKLIDDGSQKAGILDVNDVQALYRKGLIYLDVPIEDQDCVSVPPLKGFVMNRILGDYLETLLYKIFVSIDEHISVAELANILQIELELVKNAVSMYCRLGFAKKTAPEDIPLHSSWQGHSSSVLNLENPENDSLISNEYSTPSVEITDKVSSPPQKKIGFLYDSNLTAFLMMGNLSSGLRSHAVTMFEVGKLTDKTLDSFLTELFKINDVGEGEAKTYFTHAVTLRKTISFLRNNAELIANNTVENTNLAGLGLDLLRCESLQNLDTETCCRLLDKNYSLLISMAPLTNEIRPISSCIPPHLGPSIPEICSAWFKLYLYSLTKCGPPSLLLTKGTRLYSMPKCFWDHEKLRVTTWLHDPGLVPMSNALPVLNEALSHSAVLVQGMGGFPEFCYLPFPLETNSEDDKKTNVFKHHVAVKTLSSQMDLEHNCGYLVFTYDAVNQRSKTIGNKLKAPECGDGEDSDENPVTDQVVIHKDFTLNFSDNCSKNYSDLPEENELILLDCVFGIPLFDKTLNKKVCQMILKKHLCSKYSLENMVSSNRKLCLQLLEFISKHQPVINNPDITRNASFPPNRPGCDTELPLPTQNLLFYNGELSVWNPRRNIN